MPCETSSALSEEKVMTLLVNKKWQEVKDAMVGNPNRHTKLSKESQNVVLEEALRNEKLDFITDIVAGGYEFEPDTLDKVLDFAIQTKNLHLMDKTVLTGTKYTFDPDLLVSVMKFFVSEDQWLTKAHQVLLKLPDNTNVVDLDRNVCFPLSNRPTNEPVLVMNILNALRTRFQPAD
ncbi:uncharacterized protein LOC143280513 [Babylonia areolata]|uniref:uncharacterized protein LOC143280513 n=1 Tax=Babylonia areolata TaxID=304850 RepID=UPI003FCF94CD